jgi:hypothetical protein
LRGRAADLDHGSRASASCYASSGCGGLPFFLGTVVAAWSGARVSMSASWCLVSPRALSLLLLCRVCRVVFCACGVPPPEALWRVVGGWRLRRRSTPFLCFLGRLLLRDRRSVVLVSVGLSLAFVAAHGVETDGVFLYSLNYYGWLVSYYGRKAPLRGGRRCFSGRRGYYTEFL